MIEPHLFRHVRVKPYHKRKSPLSKEQDLETYGQKTQTQTKIIISHPRTRKHSKSIRSIAIMNQPPTKRILRFCIASALVLFLSILTSLAVLLQLYSKKKKKNMKFFKNKKNIFQLQSSTKETKKKFKRFAKSLFKPDHNHVLNYKLENNKLSRVSVL
ncbi:protein lyk2 [Anaeramoeba flamelloides]|uniref:Protein lyk2 n=1 Tax=Anaeramoeba flamelloides TaxID=1746091 RepID=A0ABQ8XXX4_9EUKA|nr:protein lyk2 [Anaeramoeba flamelloides]